MHLPGHPITDKAKVKTGMVGRQCVPKLLQCILLLMPMNVSDLTICIFEGMLIEPVSRYPLKVIDL